MNSVWKNEFRRAFCNKGMLLSLAIGIGIVIWHQITFVWPISMIIDDFNCVESLYYRWLGGNGYPIQNYVFFMILPLLSALPVGAIYCKDLKSQYYIHFYLRGQKRQYLLARYVVTFVVGGFSVIIPLIISIILTAMKFPAIKPELIMSYEPNISAVGYSLFFSHPFLYVMLMLFIIFIFAGGFATIVLPSSFYTQYAIVASITPFALYYFLYSLDCIFLPVSWRAPNSFLNPATGVCMANELILGAIVFLLIGVIYFRKAIRYE